MKKLSVSFETLMTIKMALQSEIENTDDTIKKYERWKEQKVNFLITPPEDSIKYWQNYKKDVIKALDEIKAE